MKQLHLFTALTPILLLSAATFIGCGSDASNPPAGTGGFTNTGGLPGTGSVAATGGMVGATGGMVGNTGGAPPASGGAPPASGGAPPASGGAPPASGGSAGTGGASGSCETAGTWALLFDVAVAWKAGGVLTCPATGCTGRQQLKLLSTRTVSGNNVTDNAKICGVTIPKFSTIVGDIVVNFPEAAWDATPGVTTTLLSTITGMGAGATFQSEDNAIVVGATLADAVTAAWPAYTAIAQKDDDNDTKPGVTAVSPNPGAPTSVLGPNADKLYLAFRTVAKISAGKNDTCDKSTGTVALKGVEQSILGCHIPAGIGAEADCNATQTQFLNENAPKWEPGADSKVTMVRLAAGATCAQVRSTTF
jgi:annexin A7/11